MKVAVPSLSKEAILEMLVEHCEKIVVGIIFLLAMWLAWSGISALRSTSATGDLLPDAIASQAATAVRHVDKQEQPPEDMLVELVGLTDSITVWTSPAEKDPRKPILSRPLFPELAKRSQPDVFAIEDLRAVPGIAVLAAVADPQEMPGGQPRPSGRPLPGPLDPAFGGMPGGPPMGPQGDPADAVPPARIVPYVIVTGLIPFAKQTDEYIGRFQDASFRDVQRDMPLWADFLVERSDITAGPNDAWERINLKAIATTMRKEWAGVQGDALQAEYFLSPTEQPGLGDLSYAWPLPQLAMESWGPEAVHPWAVADWRRRLAEQRTLPAENPGFQNPGFQNPGFQIGPAAPPTTPFGSEGALPPGFGGLPGMEPMMEQVVGPDGGMMPGGQGVSVEFKMFRFVDTAVLPGHVYRYRVRLSVWNPNYRVPAQHLAEADLAKATKLPSAPSNEAVSGIIPDEMGVLARVVPVELKRGTAEVLVMRPSERTGNYALHSVAAVAGGVLAVQKKIDEEPDGDDRKPVRPGKGKKEPLTEKVPVGMLLDFMGQQTASSVGPRQPAGRPGRKIAPPAEPFELLVLGDDGNLEFATVVDSEARYSRYAKTLPFGLQWNPTAAPGPEGMGPTSPPDAFFPGNK